MVDLKLENDEGIIQQANSVEMYKANDVYEEIYEMYLTNKNIIYYYEKSNGLFAKSEEIIEKIPLQNIRIVNDKLQISKVDNDEYGLGLQIILQNGERVHFVFDKKKELQIWYDAILEAITGEKSESNTNNNKSSKKENSIVGNFIGVVQTVKDIAKDQIDEVKEQINDVKDMFVDDEEEVNTTSNNKVEAKQKELENNKLSNNKEEKVKESIDSEEKKSMYCRNCGEKLIPNSKFCNYCGTSVNIEESTIEEKKEKIKNEIETEEFNERKTVYDGKIHKCPNCGDVVRSYDIVCPSCGFELSGKEVSKTLQRFIEKVNECEQTISNSPKINNGGWSSWSGGKKFGFIILNLVFAFIPLFIYFLLPFIKIKSKPNLSKEEQQLESLIENFPFPNDRESIIDALIFAKEKMNFISKEEMNRKNAYWFRLWSSKAEQLKHKADLLFPNDKIVNESYDKILNKNAEVNKKLKIKALIGLVLLIVAIVFLGIRSNLFERMDIVDTTNYNATIEWQDSILFNKLPHPDNENGTIISESSGQLQVEVYKVTKEDFDKYSKKCRDAGFNVDVTKTDSVFYSKDTDGFGLSIFYENKEQKMKIYIDSYNVNESVLKKLQEEKSKKDNSINSSNNEIQETSNLDNFIKGYEKAKFEKFNSFASENGLGGTKIYINCVIDKTEVLEADGTKSILGHITDEYGNKWLVNLHFIPAVSETYFDKYIGKNIVLKAVYDGFSGTRKMPYIILEEFLVNETGEIVYGVQKVVSEY